MTEDTPYDKNDRRNDPKFRDLFKYLQLSKYHPNAW